MFTPRREHARFCSAPCRVAWNRSNTSEQAVHASALDWSITAMCDATGRLQRIGTLDQARALAVISEAMWWVTIVDATLVRYHPDTYDGVLDDHLPDERQAIEGTLGGLRYVRNRMGHYLDPADFICPGTGRPGSDGVRNPGWTWKSVPEPEPDSLPPRSQAWELTRYQAYEGQLVGYTVGEVFERAVAFLRMVAARAAGDPGVADPAGGDPAAEDSAVAATP